MTTYAHRAAVADRVLAEHGDPDVTAVTLYGYQDQIDIQTTVPIPGVDYVVDGYHYSLTLVREDVPVRLAAVTTSPAEEEA